MEVTSIKPLFDIPSRQSKEDMLKVAKKSNSSSKKVATSVKGSGGVLATIQSIVKLVELHLSKYKEETLIIRDEETLHNYISVAIQNGVIAIDTETTGLNPLEDKIVGVSIYTPNMKTAYIPINHISYITHELLGNQLSADFVADELRRLVEALTKIIMFHAKFDLRVIKKSLGVLMKCYWDCMLAQRLLNETERENNLKALHRKYVLNGKEDAFRFDDLFKGVTFNLVPIEPGALYAGHDAIITFEFFKYQEPFLTETDEACISRNLQGAARVFHELEMPLVEVVADMEDTGIEFDNEYNDTLKEKYSVKLEEALNDFYSVCSKYDSEISAYRKSNRKAKLDNPINIRSNDQVAILLYDILKLPIVDKEKPRGTGEEILNSMNHEIVEKILTYRGLDKLMNTYIEKLPECVGEDNRIHCSFHQIGADTGRMSSSDPNLQNIPSHNTDIRKVFTATRKGGMKSSESLADIDYVLLSSDFS